MASDPHDPIHADDWCVTQCACGQLTLRLGAMRIDFGPEEFAQLHRLLSHAMQQFDVPLHTRPASAAKALMH
jgi:hypothetical protein